MSPGSNKSKFNGKDAVSSSHFTSDTTDNPYFELPSSLYDNPITLPNPDFLKTEPSNKKKKEEKKEEESEEEEEEKPRESKEEREKKKKIVKIGTESGVSPSHRKMTKKEKKCLEKGKKKMEKLEKREKEQDGKHGKDGA